MALSDRSLRYLAIIVLPAIVTWAAVTRGDIGMTPDSLFYWSAARTIHDKRSVAVQVSPRDYTRIIGDEHTPPDAGVVSPDGSILYPLTTWPPGYPLAIAALMPLTRGSVTGAARVLAIITLLLLVSAFAAVASQLVDPWRSAFAAALVACLPFVHFTVRMMWSDALFAALALAGLALATRSLGATRWPGTTLALAATVAALATYVRYTGPLVFAAAILVVGFVVIRDPGRRVHPVKAMLSIALYALLVAPLFVRNYQETGHLTGGERSPAGESLPRLVGQMVVAFAKGIVPWTGGTVAGPRDAVVSGGISIAAWALACGAVLLVVRRPGSLRPPPDREVRGTPMALMLAAFAALYCAVLVALRTAWHFDFNTRMLLPAVASVALLAACAFERRISDEQLWRVNAIAIVMTSLATVASLGAADHYLKWRGINDPHLLESPAVRWARTALAQSRSGRSLRFFSAGYLVPYLHFATGTSVRALPNVPEASVLLPRLPGISTVVFLEPAAGRFWCPGYRSAYERVLDMAADSTFKDHDFTAWWLAGDSAAIRLERGARESSPWKCPL